MSGKKQSILLLKIEKKESKKLKTLQKLLEQTSQSPQYMTAGRARAVEDMFMSLELTKNYALDIPGNTGTIPK